MFDLSLNALAAIFAGLMGFSVLMYAILDGYDLGVGILLPNKSAQSRPDRDKMIASIGPFWDANETWLVLAVGILLIAFPKAHSLVLSELYLPASVMLLGLILRGVAFDFRAKAHVSHQNTWDWVFQGGSLLTALCQGYMLGRYVMGFDDTPMALVFAVLSAFGVVCAYAYIGGTWLVMKTQGALQLAAIRKSRIAGRVALLGVLGVSVVNPLINPMVFERWFSLPNALFLVPLPMVCVAFFVINELVLYHFERSFEKEGNVAHLGHGQMLPFINTILIFMLAFFGLAYSFYPYVIPGSVTFVEVAAAPESLSFILAGAAFVIPVIVLYTIYSYRVFWGKVRDLSYT